jgi:SAM-dependent methyltransferase
MIPRPFLRALLAGAAVALLLVAGWAAWQRFGAGAGVPDSQPRLDVPYVATIEEVVDRMLALAEVGASDHVIDLGCGDGRILVAAARDRGATGFGVDLDPRRIREAEANARTAGVGDKLRFQVQDLFQAPIADADVVAIYLLPEINLRLRPRLLAELRPGARLVSHAFDMGDWRPDRTAEVEGARIYLWIIPARVAGRWTLTDQQGRSATVAIEQSYQRISGTITTAAGTRPLAEAQLAGDRLSFVADAGGGARSFEGRVAGPRIAAADFRMARVD